MIAATAALCVRGAEKSLASGKGIPDESRGAMRQPALTTGAQSAPRVALVTFGPGRVYWERFGHNAIIVDDPSARTRIAYNYGVFDFEEKHFLLNFALGHMHYSLDAEPLDEELAPYVQEGRSVTVQILNLSRTQARQLATFLAWNAQPQNAGYRYDYLVNNCSTRVRDALNRVLGGALERQLARRPAPHTYRRKVNRLRIRIRIPVESCGQQARSGLGRSAQLEESHFRQGERCPRYRAPSRRQRGSVEWRVC